jgi:hypothetical protein
MREREESSDVRKGPEEILFLFVFLNPGGPFILFILFIYFWNVDRDTRRPDLNR